MEEGDGNITNTKFLWDIHMEMIIHLLKLEARERSWGGNRDVRINGAQVTETTVINNKAQAKRHF